METDRKIADGTVQLLLSQRIHCGSILIDPAVIQVFIAAAGSDRFRMLAAGRATSSAGRFNGLLCHCLGRQFHGARAAGHDLLLAATTAAAVAVKLLTTAEAAGGSSSARSLDHNRTGRDVRRLMRFGHSDGFLALVVLRRRVGCCHLADDHQIVESGIDFVSRLFSHRHLVAASS